MRNDPASNLRWIEHCLAEADIEHTAEQLAKAETLLRTYLSPKQPELPLAA